MFGGRNAQHGRAAAGVAPPWWKRRQMLLLGAAVIALGAAGASAFLVSPYNRVYPVPQMASTVRHWAAEIGIKRTEPLAPARIARGGAD